MSCTFSKVYFGFEINCMQKPTQFFLAVVSEVYLCYS